MARHRWSWCVLAAAVGVSVVAWAAPTAAAGELSAAQLAAGADHACIVGNASAVRIDWSALANPVLSYPNAGAKDEAIVWADGRWHMLFSYLTHDRTAPGGVRWDIASATSADLTHWSAPRAWPRQPGTDGVASPDVVRTPAGRFVVTYQSNPAAHGQDKLYYRTSSDLQQFSAPHPLAPSLAPAPGDRQIDAALAFTGHGVLLGFKAGTAGGDQHFEVARSANGSLSGPWALIGRPDISLYNDTIENYEFVYADGHWDLVATSNELDQPWLFQLDGDPATPASWLHWSTGRQLQVPAQPWDSGQGLTGENYEQDNSAFLCDAQSAGGYYYLLYAGSNELTQFGGWGHAAIGIARSTDLVHWQIPPPAPTP
jgi:hypothetical protein